MTPADMAVLHADAMETRPWSAAEFADLLAAGAFATGPDHALALGRVAGDEAELLTLATAPAHRRRGLGRQALRAFCEEARRHGATRAFLEVAEGNAPARALYAAEGFVEVGRRPGYYRLADGRREAALVLQKPL